MILSEDFKRFVKEHEGDDPHTLCLQKKRFPDIDLQLAVKQIQGRQIAKYKLPQWYINEDVVYPKHLPLEQCSSEYTAKYKASLCNGELLIDITGGLGIDFYYMSNSFNKSVYIDKDPELAALAASNFKALGLHNFEVQNGDGVQYLQTSSITDWLYIDPARRSASGKKVFLLKDCSPDILSIESLIKAKSKKAMIKLSPMIDISHVMKSLRNVSDVHIISYQNECKELVFIKDNTNSLKRTLFHCVNIEKTETSILVFSKEEEEGINANYAPNVGKYLYEPNASILKGGAYKFIAKAFSIEKLHPNSHLYTNDNLCDDFYGRTFIVEQVYGFSKNDIKNVSELKSANISTRNFPISVAELRKRLRLLDGGDKYIFATTLADNKKVLIICHKA